MLIYYTRVASRNLLKNKVYSLISILGLSVGIACCILVGLFVYHELSYESHHENSDRIYRVATELDFNGTRRFTSSSPGLLGSAAIEQIRGVANASHLTLRPQAQIQSERISGYESVYLSDSTLPELFSIQMVKGSSSSLLQPGSVALSLDMARKYFGDDEALGKTLVYNEIDLIVSGIIENPPSHTDFPLHILVNPDATPLTWDPYTDYTTFLLLDPDSDPITVEEQLFELSQANTSFPLLSGYNLERLDLIHFSETFGATGDIRYLYIFSVVAFFLFLISNINHVNLSIAQLIPRSREAGIRKTLGASRVQLAMQFLMESLILGSVAVMGSLLLVDVMHPVINAIPGITLAPIPILSIEFFGILLLLIFVTACITGSYIIFILLRFGSLTMNKSKNWQPHRNSLLSKGLITFQFAASIALICGTFIAQNQLDFMRESRLGFDQEQVLVLDLKGEFRHQHDVLKERLSSLSGIEAVAASEGVPGGGGFSILFLGDESPVPNIHIMPVDEDFTEIMEMTMVSQSNQRSREGDWLVNESAAEVLGITEGVQPKISDLLKVDEEEYPGEVTGIIDDFHYVSMHNEIKPLIMPIRSSAFSNISIRLQAGNIDNTMDQIRMLWSEFAPGIPLDYYFLDDRIDQMYQSDRRFAEIFSWFSAITILIACVGLFGLTALSAEKRTREIGIRKVLGASVINVVTLMGTDYLKPVIIGYLIAIPVSWYFMNQWLTDFAYRITLGPGIYLLAGGTALMIAIVTVSWHSYKAALANPVDSLKTE